jgi:hypothetical protein
MTQNRWQAGIITQRFRAMREPRVMTWGEALHQAFERPATTCRTLKPRQLSDNYMT